MQLQQLRYVVAVAEERHFTRAAARLRVAQPSLSSQVRALEDELGAPLFVRSRRSVSLTAAGEEFLPWARQALADGEAGREAVRELLGLRRGRLAIGATPSLMTGLLPPVLARFHAAYPAVNVRLRQAGSRELVPSLDAGELDVALVIVHEEVGGPANGRIATRPLADEELVLAVAPDHPLAARRALRITDLRDVPLVGFREGYDLRETTLAACRAAGFEPRLALEGGEMDGVLALAAAGLGAAVVPLTALPAHGTLRGVRFGSGMPRRTVGLARSADRPLARAAEVFESVLLEGLAGTGWPGGHRPGLHVRET